jgi:hypothetical protein
MVLIVKLVIRPPLKKVWRVKKIEHTWHSVENDHQFIFASRMGWSPEKMFASSKWLWVCI